MLREAEMKRTCDFQVLILQKIYKIPLLYSLSQSKP